MIYFRMNMKASVFIPTKNAGKKFNQVLARVFAQKEVDFEVIIVDSGSKDKTLSIAKGTQARIYEIPSQEFSHGKTRNLALRYAEGDFIVYLSQDAMPADSFWLK